MAGPECYEGVEGDVNKDYDVIIIGGGPAALAAAVYTCRALLKTIILEKKYLGGQLVGTELIENYPGFPEVIGGVELTQRMESQAKRFGAEIRYEEVLKLDVENGLKVVTTDTDKYVSHIVILATGADPKKLGVPGEEEFYGKGVSYCATCDGAFYRGKNVVTKEKKDIPCYGFFIFVGSSPNTGFLGSLLCVDAGCHIETNIHMETEIEGLYAVGDIRKNSYRQIATAIGEGVTAAIATEHKLAELKASGKSKK